jgi:hypothetical protein
MMLLSYHIGGDFGKESLVGAAGMDELDGGDWVVGSVGSVRSV